jgi:hypothetical protein
VANERPKNIGILWKIVLGKGRHHAPGIEQHNVKLYTLTERERMTNPVVLDETRLLFRITFIRNLRTSKRSIPLFSR